MKCSDRWIVLACCVILGTAVWGGYRLWPRKLDWRPTPLIPAWRHIGGRDVVALPGRFLVAEIGTYDNEFLAFLMFRYLQGSAPFRGTEVLLTYTTSAGRITYPIQVNLGTI